MAIIRTLPFTFHLHPAVGRRMPEAGVGARQRILARLKHAQVDRGLLVCRRVSYFIRVWLPVSWTTGRLRGSSWACKAPPPMHPVSHHGAHSNFAVSRDELHPGATLNSARRSSASSGETSTNVSGVFSRIPSGSCKSNCLHGSVPEAGHCSDANQIPDLVGRLVGSRQSGKEPRPFRRGN